MKHPTSQKFHPTNQSTIAELNKVSIKQSSSAHNYNPNFPFRIRLPQYFNIPAFQDDSIENLLALNNRGSIERPANQNKMVIGVKEDAVFKKRMKDLALLAEGMKRAKNIKQESRYYFTQGVLLHNANQYIKSIEYFQKFTKIVLYLQDLKSVELAFNVIGCAYMLSGDYKKALQFHEKQGQVSARADQFLSLINMGLCQQLLGDAKQAYSLYQRAQVALDCMDSGQDKQMRMEALEKVVERVEIKLRDNELFMTQNQSQKSPNKSIQNSILKEQSSLLLKKTSNRKQYQKNKLKYAIHAAEEKIEQHLQSSITFQSP